MSSGSPVMTLKEILNGEVTEKFDNIAGTASIEEYFWISILLRFTSIRSSAVGMAAHAVGDFELFFFAFCRYSMCRLRRKRIEYVVRGRK